MILAAALALVAMQAPPAEPLLHDDRGRPMVQARLNDRGPFPMVVDTAAEASLVVPGVVAELKLEPLPETITITGATGQEESRQYRVARFQSGLFDAHDVRMVALPNVGSTSARGIVGVDIFRGRKLVFDRTGNRFAAEPSSAPSPGYVAIAGSVGPQGFVTVPVTIGGATVQATIDTGAAISVANHAALRAMGWEEDDPRLAARGAIQGASAAGQAVKSGIVGSVRIGPATLRDVPVFFSDSGGDQPSLLLGSDLLNALMAYAVDFGRGELHVRVP